MIFDLIKTEQIQEALNKGKNLILDFYADWCPPCRKLLPVLYDVSKLNKYEDLIIIKINVDVFAALSKDYSITSIPTLVFLKDNGDASGKRYQGFHAKEDLISYIDEYFY